VPILLSLDDDRNASFACFVKPRHIMRHIMRLYRLCHVGSPQGHPAVFSFLGALVRSPSATQSFLGAAIVRAWLTSAHRLATTTSPGDAAALPYATATSAGLPATVSPTPIAPGAGATPAPNVASVTGGGGGSPGGTPTPSLIVTNDDVGERSEDAEQSGVMRHREGADADACRRQPARGHAGGPGPGDGDAGEEEGEEAWTEALLFAEEPEPYERVGGLHGRGGEKQWKRMRRRGAEGTSRRGVGSHPMLTAGWRFGCCFQWSWWRLLCLPPSPRH